MKRTCKHCSSIERPNLQIKEKEVQAKGIVNIFNKIIAENSIYLEK
jgi:hypothetical protein